MHPKPLVFTLLFLACLFFNTVLLPQTGSGEETNLSLATHEISISFNLKNRVASGTSKITLPKDTPLTLYCGPLQITGNILKRQEQPPVSLKITEKATIELPASTTPQTLFLSWILKAEDASHNGNLISTEGIVLAGFWHPVAKQDMYYRLSAALPSGFTGISEGEQIRRKQKKNGQEIQTEFPYPLQALHFAAGPYVVQSIQQGKVLLSTYFFKEDRELAGKYLKEAGRFIHRYEQLIGSFPYTRYSIVENRLPTGYGMPGFTLLGQSVVRLPFIKDTSLGHEILHSWFGNSIGLAENSGNWCEGLTSYLADQSFAAEQGKGAAYRKNQCIRYQAFVPKDNALPLMDFTGTEDNHPMAKRIRAIGYDKSSMVFHMLKKSIGEEAFVQGLRDLYKQKKNKRASWLDIQETFSRAAGNDLKSFFQQWLERTDIPQLSIEQVSVHQEEGRSTTSFHLVQKNERPYGLQIPVVIKTVNGEKRVQVNSSRLDDAFNITTESLPVEIIMDPDYDVLRHLDEEETPPTWSGFLGAQQKTFIVPENSVEASRYKPLAELLQTMGVAVLQANEMSNQALESGSFLFAGDSGLRRSLFADFPNNHSGFTLQARKNPFDTTQTIILVDSTSVGETMAVLHKLSHYGKYSRLQFANGRLAKKAVTPADRGYRISLLPNPKGMPTRAVDDFTTIMNNIKASQVIYVGETHPAYGDHLLQLRILQALYAKNKNLAIGMEMFPRSSQEALDAFTLEQRITEPEFIKESKYFSVWGFDYRLYRDILGFARRHHLKVIGLNLEKSIVSQVFREGNTDGISESDLTSVASERNLDIPGYQRRLQTIHAQHTPSPHGTKNTFRGFLQAQALWDETMAESIANYLQSNPNNQIIIMAGVGHVYKDSGIPPRVKRRIPAIKQKVLTTDNGLDSGLEQGKTIDYLIFTQPMEVSPAPKIGVVLKEEEGNGENNKGWIRIVGISPHGKGKEAGLQEQDIIMSVDGTPVHDIADLKIILLDKEAGEHVPIEVIRNNNILSEERLRLQVELTAMPSGTVMMPPGHPK